MAWDESARQQLFKQFEAPVVAPPNIHKAEMSPQVSLRLDLFRAKWSMASHAVCAHKLDY